MMWGRKSKITLAKVAATKAGQNAYVGRKLKKRNNRALQQVRINAAARMNGTTFSKLIGDLHKRKIVLDRKVLAELAMNHPAVFAKIVKA
jgi:large subunit ribosomal protein L20